MTAPKKRGPKQSGPEPITARFGVALMASEVARIDGLRGDESRSSWVRRAVRVVDPTTPTG